MKTITLRHQSNDVDHTTGAKPNRIATSVMHSITALWLLCARQAIIASQKLKHNAKPKKLISTISNKAIRLSHRKRRTGGNSNDDDGGVVAGDDGLWQREILMGDKCQPLDFSGVIYYDREGKRTEEYPTRSPRASPLNGYVAKFDWVPRHER